jgi:uncharacterized protein
MSMVGKSLQSGFGIAKETTLPRWCRECELLVACYGGCPKHRFVETIYGEPGLHYLCIGYKNFYHHISKYMKAFMHLMNNGIPFDYIMQAIEQPTIFTSKVNGQQLMLWVK